MSDNINKKRAREYARIQIALLAYNASGFEFDDTHVNEKEQSNMRGAVLDKVKTMIKDEAELRLATQYEIIEYVKTHF